MHISRQGVDEGILKGSALMNGLSERFENSVCVRVQVKSL